MPDVPKGSIPDHILLQKTRVVCQKDAPIYCETINYSSAYMGMGVDNGFSLESFKKGFRVDVKSLTDDTMVFDLVGIDVALANAFRRILIAEVPTMAVEKVFIMNNTSILQDEVLSHRLGMVPIKVDPRKFEFKTDEDVANEKNTIVFRINVKCTRKGEKLQNPNVLSSHMEWLPGGSELPATGGGTGTMTSFSRSQAEDFADDPIQPFYPDIVLAKLRPGHEVELEAHCVKGQGSTHAKWSPVATAWYRLLPEVVFLKEVRGQHAEQLVKCCPARVFDIEDLGGGGKRAVAARPRDCTLCRECVRPDGWEEYVELRRVKDHYIFTIESTGAYRPDKLFLEAVKILQSKCDRISAALS
eukprot:jgi/Mesvir1/6541/Mv16802-RA.1